MIAYVQRTVFPLLMHPLPGFGAMIGFLVNPIAGMGGSVGLKGTDGDAYFEAIRRGAKPVAPSIATRFVEALTKLCREDVDGRIVAAPRHMGSTYLEKVGIKHEVLDVEIPDATSADDTKRCVEKMLEKGVALVLFVGGDGTARDIASVVGDRVPILGIPSGVKMYSGVFAVSPEAAARIVCSYLRGEAEVVEAEVADIDEDAFRRDELRVRLYYLVKSVSLGTLLTPSKEVSVGEEEAKKAIARYFVERVYDPAKLTILGPGTTVKAIAEELGVGRDKTVLGFDALLNGRIIAKDVWGEHFLELVKRYVGNKMMVLTPIGGQGFLIGRGNKQLTPEILSLFSKDEILIVATPGKLRKLRVLYIDTGDRELDKKFSGYYKALCGYGEYAVVKVVPASEFLTHA